MCESKYQNEACDVNRSNAQDVWKILFELDSKKMKYRFNLGDQVKISKHKQIFEKGYSSSWTEEAFTIAQRLPRDLPAYRLSEADGYFIQGTLYKHELRKVIETPDHLFRVEKVLKFRGKGGNKKHWYTGIYIRFVATLQARGGTAVGMFQDNDFYITIPSNSSSNLFLTNSMSCYRVALP